MCSKTMSAQEAKTEIAAIRDAGKEIRKSPESVRKFLLKHKILTAKGQLAKRFGG